MAKTERRETVATIRRNAREQISVDLVELDGLGPFAELSRIYVPLDPNEPPRLMENGLALSVSTRHLPALASAFMASAQRAVELGLLSASDLPAKVIDRPKGGKRAA
jgi:hypothetical protein